MAGEFTAIIERDGDWYISYCAEIPGANGRGRTKEERLSKAWQRPSNCFLKIGEKTRYAGYHQRQSGKL
jgi:hypothetical protein